MSEVTIKVGCLNCGRPISLGAFYCDGNCKVESEQSERAEHTTQSSVATATTRNDTGRSALINCNEPKHQAFDALVAAAREALEWFKRAPIDELDAVSEALGQHPPMTELDAALKLAEGEGAEPFGHCDTCGSTLTTKGKCWVDNSHEIALERGA